MMNVVYCGFFIDADELYGLFPPTLAKPIERPHVTTVFRPKVNELHPELLGTCVTFDAIAYGNDGRNEGLLVRAMDADSQAQELIGNIAVPHITLSISQDGKAVDTAKLSFELLEQRTKIVGKYGFFLANGDVIFTTNK